MDKLIKIKNLQFGYDKENNLFDRFDLEIELGSFVSIIGKNGSGKSTLIKLLIGLLSYKNGYVSVNNNYLDKENIKEIRRDVGVVFDRIDDNLPMETVIDNLVFSLENLGYSNDEIEEEISNIIDMFHLSNILDKDPYNLNNSLKEWVAIACVLITKPKILILDDCINQLSVSNKRNLFDILKRYHKKYKTTIILITHDLEDTIDSDRIIVLDKGKIILDNTPFKVFKQEDILRIMQFKLPFMVDLSLTLMKYNLIDHIYLDKEKLGDDLWK